MREKEQERSVESVALGIGVKYGGRLVLRFLPSIKIIFSLFLVRVGLKETVSFKMKYMGTATAWSNRLGIGKTRQYKYTFPDGIQMHRAIGIPDYDNSEALTIMSFERKC